MKGQLHIRIITESRCFREDIGLFRCRFVDGGVVGSLEAVIH